MAHNRHNNHSQKLESCCLGTCCYKTATQTSTTCHSILCIECVICRFELHRTGEAEWQNNFTGLPYIKKCLLQLLLEGQWQLSNIRCVYKRGRCRLHNVRCSDIQETLKQQCNIFKSTISLDVFCSYMCVTWKNLFHIVRTSIYHFHTNLFRKEKVIL